MKKTIGLAFLLFTFSLYSYSQTKENDSIPDLRYMVLLDNVPQIQGGDEAFARLLESKITFPPKIDYFEKGAGLLVGFFIDTNGKPRDIELCRLETKEAGKASMDFLRFIPDFTPAILNGKPVETYVKLWIGFENDSEKQFAVKISHPQRFYAVRLDKPLQFEGGQQAIATYFTQNMNLNVNHLKKKEKKTANVDFIVSPEGKITDVQPEDNKLKAELVDEAVRLIENMPDWQPAMLNGKNVSTFYSAKIVFNTKDGKTIEPQPTKDIDKNIVMKPKLKAPAKDGKFKPDRMPVFVGGEQAMYAYIGKNLEYPPNARKAKRQGKVLIRFVVKKDGSINDVEVRRGISFDLDNEAKRVLASMPKWVPGNNEGVNVEMYYTIPIVFKMR